MGDFLFVIRTFIVTVVVLLILQVKVGDFTLEQRSMNWVRSSVVVSHLQEVADGSIVFIERNFKKLKAYVSSRSKEKAKEEIKAHRTLINFERSKEYLTEKAKVAKKVVSDTVNSAVKSVGEVRDEMNEQAQEEVLDDLESSEDFDSTDI